MQTGSAIIEDWERLRTVDVNVVYYTRYEMSDVGVQMSESMVSGWMSSRMSETVAHSGAPSRIVSTGLASHIFHPTSDH